MAQSILPEDLEQDNIYRMSPGDIGYTMYWAIAADSYRHLWIRGDYPIYPEPQGIEASGAMGQDRFVKIERTRDGVIVYRSTLSPQAKYEPGHGLHPGWYPLPVELK